MALILNIETATDVCSVALSESGKVISEAEHTEGYQHASKITLLIEQCMREANKKLPEVNAIAVSAGPGSYTGLRIGLSTAKGLCYGLGIPLISVSTLEALAARSHQVYPNADYYIPMIDARRMEVYTSFFDSKMTKVKEDHALIIHKDSFDDLLGDGLRIIFSGNGMDKFRVILNARKSFIFSENKCAASNLAAIADRKHQQGIYEDPAYYVPFYLKSPNITKPKKIF